LVTTAKSIHEVLPVGLMWVWPSTTCWNEKLWRMVQRWENRKWECICGRTIKYMHCLRYWMEVQCSATSQQLFVQAAMVQLGPI